MSTHQPISDARQGDLFDPQAEAARALIDQLIAETELYTTSKDYAELLDFVARLRGFAPFNAMLLHIQKPGLTHAASARDWWNRFRRTANKHARPLLVLRAMGPVDFVFDILDTEGDDVPVDAFTFPALGDMSEERFTRLLVGFDAEKISLVKTSEGDSRAGYIQLFEQSTTPRGKHRYCLGYNGNHPPTTRFVTLAHELAHLFLGHLGSDHGRNVPDRRDRDHALREVEAETAAYLVARRNGVKPRSETYLQDFKGSFRHLDSYAVMRAANAIEKVMGISANRLWQDKDPEGRKGHA